jgi:hypothetical protein
MTAGRRTSGRFRVTPSARPIASMLSVRWWAGHGPTDQSVSRAVLWQGNVGTDLNSLYAGRFPVGPDQRIGNQR